MTLSLLSGPALEPVTLAEAKLFLRIDHVDEDSVLQALITASRIHIERLTRRLFLNQSWRLYLDEIPVRQVVEFGIGPVNRIDRVIYFDEEGLAQEISPDEYTLDGVSAPPRLKFHLSVRPQTSRSLNGYEIDFIAGFGATTLDIPHDLRHAVLLLVAHWYENRSAVSPSSLAPTPHTVNELVQPYRVVQL